MSLPKIQLNGIQDLVILENFKNILEYLRKESHFDSFRHFELTFTNPVIGFKLKHNLGFLPKDIILTSQIGSGVVVFDYSEFTANELVINLSGTVTSTNPTIIRFLAGSYKADQ